MKQEVRSAIYKDRPNRFLAVVEMDGIDLEAFLPNPGRMNELLIPGSRVYLVKKQGDTRKTDYNLIAVEYESMLVSLDANLPNRFMRSLLQSRATSIFGSYNSVQAEPRIYGGRFDFLLEGEQGSKFIEVKSCTLVTERRALFPDAPTSRGVRHMKHLAASLKKGDAAAAYVVFVVQRPDAMIFSPNDATDPRFGNALRDACSSGVKPIAMRTSLQNWELRYEGTIPIDLDYFIQESKSP